MNQNELILLSCKISRCLDAYKIESIPQRQAFYLMRAREAFAKYVECGGSLKYYCENDIQLLQSEV